MPTRLRLSFLASVLAIAVLLGVRSQTTDQAAPAAPSVNMLGGRPVGAQEPPASPPVIPRRAGQSIASRIPPGATSVVVIDATPAPFTMPIPEGMSRLEYETRLHDAVGIVRIEGRHGELTPEGDFILSTLDAVVVEVLKPAAGGQLVPGQQKVTLRVIGGVTTVGNVTVTAKSASVEPVQPGDTYLMFLVLDSEGFLRPSPDAQFKVAGSSLWPLDSRGHRGMPDSLSEMVAGIRRFKDLPPAFPKGGLQ